MPLHFGVAAPQGIVIGGCETKCQGCKIEISTVYKWSRLAAEISREMYWKVELYRKELTSREF